MGVKDVNIISSIQNKQKKHDLNSKRPKSKCINIQTKENIKGVGLLTLKNK